ncbi:RimK family alpha-L-glutamate ligase [Alicyclobacillus sp. SO9]|uniref:ATP-grasp domain-containing protein n=1 Tax=Alicyclobacillus sp. SO9 TaxID=2665646 RepID=UPI0018E71A3D|nr:hypothetical protein [Alicyclobacillus sp. SO9]QQE78246.1 hypothetical protein GI364_20565 [Alicyclobacillus sp. SO9]
MKKAGWLVYRRKEAERNRNYIEWMMTEARRMNWVLMLVYRDEVVAGVMNGQPHVGWVNDAQTDVQGHGRSHARSSQLPDFVIMRTVDPVLTTHLEHLHIPVFNSSAVSRICNNKAATYQYLQQFDVPMLNTAFCNTEDLKGTIRDEVSIDGIRKRVCESDSAFVIKTVSGRGGKDVALIETSNDLENFISKYPDTDVVLQQLGPNPGKDVRVFVVGKEIVAAVLRSSTSSDFRANFSLGGRAQRYILSASEKDVVRRIMSHFEFGMVGIDFLPDGGGGLLFNEIEDVVGSRTLSLVAPEINIVRRYFRYIDERLS